ncbi:D-glycero-beta-D-manno-heptose 1-phosphate adenylyltransferase [Marivirga harenae]|uniref:D-glycero-beta-D-manno-heptose 1-phosphate adenylyltransferase n=1 Tax=Marivirga harenae TaxID=2010992 RepID=UPI0026DFFD08|nr:D-glycero-beta-D-manno-heptose 1-phosphate adenylyltransferase [Marivirga harenae]WKV12934.1 D-glycero-beta-D-manno-heptose 1-phosphate adenylyltransferase [Marivirga harenae]|tara:strand:+ start:48034 stop:48504 length:471 start_codon:yes stop_codon:yes gene_type:complete
MPTADKIYSLDALTNKRKEWKDQKVVFTNGCFDILHLGHVDYLEKAAAKGDKLIVALNTDTSVSKIKGPNRPINNEKARARLIAALSFVDAVTFFSDDTPLSLIKLLIPDVLVKGSDYNLSNIVGANIVMENGGNVETIDLVEGYSTTNIINKINQ